MNAFNTSFFPRHGPCTWTSHFLGFSFHFCSVTKHATARGCACLPSARAGRLPAGLHQCSSCTVLFASFLMDLLCMHCVYGRPYFSGSSISSTWIQTSRFCSFLIFSWRSKQYPWYRSHNSKISILGHGCRFSFPACIHPLNNVLILQDHLKYVLYFPHNCLPIDTHFFGKYRAPACIIFFLSKNVFFKTLHIMQIS